MPRLLRVPWHEAMLSCVQKHTEAPDRFIMWTSFSILGSVMKRRFWINDGLYTVYPNQYIVMIAPPGIGKGTAMQFIYKINREMAPNFLINMISDRVTGPRIIERIATGWSSAPQMIPAPGGGAQIKQGTTEHSCTLYSTELSILLGASEQMIDFLCECWDRNEYDYDTKHSGSSFIKDMSVSLIAATVPDFIRNIDRNRAMSIKGGFTSRCLFIYEEKGSRFLLHPPPIQTNPSSMKILSELKSDLQYISLLPGGEFTYNAAAKILFDDFITKIRANTQNDSEPVAHFKSRIRAHILKLAMVISASHQDSLIIDDIDMRTAILCVKSALDTLEKVFRGSGDSDMAMATAHVQNYLDRTGGASRKSLLRDLHRHMDADTLDRILYVLTEIDYVKTVTSGKGAAVMYVPLNGASSNGSKNGKVGP